MQIGLLGPLEIRTSDGTLVPVGGQRLRRLVVLLALDVGRVVTTGQLIDGVWPDQPPAAPTNALQALVSRLRRTVPALSVVSRPTGYRLDLPADAVDAHRFETAVRHARTVASTDSRQAVRLLDEALGLWRGPALADLADADIARGSAARWHNVRITALEELAEVRLGLGQADSLVPWLRELVTDHPLRERPAALLIRALRDTGRLGEALAEYERIRTALADAFGIDPTAELSTLHLALLRGEQPGPAPAPVRHNAEQPEAAPVAVPPRESSSASGNTVGRLPASVTSFVGREEALRRIVRLLAGSRLVTLTGPGGTGKTRLAVESARLMRTEVADGVWLVELASVTDVADVPVTVLGALGLREPALLPGNRTAGAGGEVPDPLTRLGAALGHRELLLVLDNCEHLIDAVATVADRLLAASPRLRILATSREPVGITGETLCPVEPLAPPPANADPQEALRFPAVQLFADRARAARPDFTVDNRTVRMVVQICRALDGMPLAIELAAARLRSLTVTQVAERLDDRFRLLTGGNRTALPRHQTLRAVVDWSWDLLDEGERALWRRLAVFTGGADLEMVERVCAYADLDRADVLDLLAGLVEKSLVVVVGDAEPRYRMLETIQEYGLARLDEAGEADRVHRAHALEFLALAEETDPQLRQAGQLDGLRRLGADQDNLHAALRWALATRDAGVAVRFAAALGWYWWLAGQRVEGADLTEEAVTLAEETGLLGPATALAYALGAMNVLAARADLDQLQRWTRRAAELIDALDTPHPMLTVVRPMSTAFGDPPAGLNALAALFDHPDPWAGAVARLMHAHTHLNLGRPSEAAATTFAESFALFRQAGDRWGVSATLFALADLTARQGDHPGAIAHLEQALEATSAFGTTEDLVQMRGRLGQQYWLAGNPERAFALLDAAREEAERVGTIECRVSVAHVHSEVLRAAGSWSAAVARLDQVSELVGQPSLAPQWRALATGALAHLAVGTGDLVSARSYLDTAFPLALGSHDAPVVASVVVGFADLALHQGRPTEAATLLGVADAVRGGPDRSAMDLLRVAAATRTVLGEAAFAEAYARGGSATLATIGDWIDVSAR